MINHIELSEAIRNLKPYHKLYRTLKRELGAQGWWKNKPRWQPPKGRMTQKGDKKPN